MTEGSGLVDMGNRQAQFEALVQAYSADLYRFAFWLSRDRSHAEDLVQETFFRAWRSLGSLQSESSAKAWLLTILRNEHARMYRRRRVEAPADDGDLLESIPEQEVEPAVAGLRQALKRLPEEYREPLLLQVIGGFSAEEIGRMIGASAPAVLTRLFRARQKLRIALTQNSDVATETGGTAKLYELL